LASFFLFYFHILLIKQFENQFDKVLKKNELLGGDPVLVHGDISVDAWVLLVSAADAPRGGADHLAAVDNWSAGVTLAGVLAADIENTSAEHALENRAVVVVSIVADRVLDNVYVNALELVGVVCDDAGGGVAPTADFDFGAVWHPFAVPCGREGQSFNSVAGLVERTGPLEDSDVVLLVAAVIRRVSDELRDRFLLLIAVLLIFYVVRAGDGGDTTAVVAMRSSDTLAVIITKRAAAKVAAASLEREDVLLRMRGSSGTSDDNGHRLEGAGGGDETNGELHFLL